MGKLADTNWQDYYEQKVTYPEADAPDDDRFGCYAMAALGDDLFLGFSPTKPMNANGAMIVRWSGGEKSFLRAPYEGGLNAMTAIGDTLWVPGTDLINVYDEKIGSVYSYTPGDDDARVIDHRQFANGAHVMGINGSGSKLYVGAQINGQGATIFVRNDDGASWNTLKVFGTMRVYDVLPVSGSLFAVLDTKELKISLDQGRSWATVQDGDGADLSVSATARLVDLGDGSLLTPKSNLKKIYRVTASGDVQETIDLPSPLQQTATYNPLACSGDQVFALCSDGLYATGTSFQGWGDAIKPLNPKTCGAVCWWQAQGRVVYSTVGGAGTVHSKAI